MGGVVGEAIRRKTPILCDEKAKMLDGAIDIPITAGDLLYTSPLISKDETGVPAVTCVLQWTTLAGDFTDMEGDDGSHFEPESKELINCIHSAQCTMSVW